MKISVMLRFLGKSEAVLFVTGLPLAMELTSCDKHENSERNDYIEIYADPSAEGPISAAYIDVRGGSFTYYVKSSVDFTAYWEDSYTSEDPWVTEVNVSNSSVSGFKEVTIEADSRDVSAYTQRSGMLTLAANDEELYFNKFLPVYQGMTARISCTFSWLRYASTDPQFTDGETSIANWTATQTAYGYTSTTISGEPVPHCYGRYGYVKLGDDAGHGGDIITPYTSTLHNDSLLVVSFRAVAYTDSDTGEKDSNKLTIEVQDGGVITDFADTEGTSIDFEVGYYDPKSENYPDDIWNGTDYLVFVKSTEANPITLNTKIRFIAGSMTTAESTNNRIFLTYIYVRRYTDLEPDYFEDNGGSGLDKILPYVKE